jgi:ribosomal protein S18 acetylase RimI-like enzyme
MIRLISPTDYDIVRDIAVEVFSEYGDYSVMLPENLLSRGIITFGEERDGRLVGFIQIGFFESLHISKSIIADILAIGVTGKSQRAGIGTELLNHALSYIRKLQNNQIRVEKVQLSVAQTNPEARKLFERMGFIVTNFDAGRYQNGQIAIHMEYRWETDN